jgi:hypothetical protein
LASVLPVRVASPGKSSLLVDVSLVPNMCEFLLSTAVAVDVDVEDEGIGPLTLTARANIFDKSCLLRAPSSNDGRAEDEPSVLNFASY